MITLRKYQVKAISQLEQAEREGVRRPLVVHPTGVGKTVTASAYMLARASLGRSLFLVHREELARQTMATLKMVAPELRTGIVKADLDEVDADVVIGSVATLARDNRLTRMIESVRRSPLGTIVVDEAHHAPAPSWMKILTALGSFSAYGPMTAGFTATPERDGKPLSVWERVVAYMSIREAIWGDGTKGSEGGYLVPVLPAQTVQTSMDLDRVRKSGGDYADGSLGEALEASGAIEQIADAYVEYGRDRKGVAFTPTVKTAHLLAEALSKRGIPAAALDGTTPTDVRQRILQDLKNYKIQVVVNCGVLTEGFDEPSISCVVVARPTKFHGLYVQMVGRGTRLYPGKANLLVLDVTGASKRHELVSLVDLGLDEPAARRKKPTEDADRMLCPSCDSADCGMPDEHHCRLCGRYLPARVVRDGDTRHESCKVDRAEKVDVFGSSRLRWLPVGNAWCLAAGKEIVVMVPAGVDIWKLAAYENGRVQVLHDEVPGHWARGIGEDRAKAFQKLVERDARWLGQPVSDAQKSRLVREGLPQTALPRVRTRGDAADLITRIQGRRAVKKILIGV